MTGVKKCNNCQSLCFMDCVKNLGHQTGRYQERDKRHQGVGGESSEGA